LRAKNIIPGHYRVDVYVNNTLVVSGSDVEFRSVAPDNTVQPCLTRELMMAAQLKSLAGKKRDDEGECRPLQAWAAGGSWQFDQSTLRLQLSIPSTELLRTTRGYIPPSEWDEGMPALFAPQHQLYHHGKYREPLSLPVFMERD
jgi:outer membrane usher protein